MECCHEVRTAEPLVIPVIDENSKQAFLPRSESSGHPTRGHVTAAAWLWENVRMYLFRCFLWLCLWL